MKNLILFFSLIAICSSCNKNAETFEEQIMGEWEINSFVINSCPDASDNVAMVTANGEGCIDIMGDVGCLSLVLKANGVAELREDYQSSSEPDIQTMTYVLEEATNSFSLCSEADDCVTFRMDGDDLYNDMDEDGCICTFGFRKAD